ncbi:MAG: hypothetical protein FD123_956 [Bacteroidetes bacterium]|nr:MAG: hypothetical protein FD123_956 [Bacteroidota bacterium]
MFNFFKKDNNPETGLLTKCATIYISDKFKHVIIARCYENNAGIIYEQDACFTSDYPIDLTNFGEEIINSLNLYSVKDKNLRDSKLTDWPAYNQSKCKSVASFEKEYIPISVCSANNSNLVLILEGRPFENSELTINSSISFHADKQELGERIKDVYDACLTGKLF